MIKKRLSAGIFSLVLSGCIVGPGGRDGPDNWSRGRVSSECAEQARSMGLRRVIDVEPARSKGRGEWETIVHATDQAGRDVRVRCSYDPQSRRWSVDRTGD
jgi:hypothetical protein